MQVSWIDADRLKALVEQIAPQEEHAVAPPPPVMEIGAASDEFASWVPEHDLEQKSVVEEHVECAEQKGGMASFDPEPPIEHEDAPECDAEMPAGDVDENVDHDSHGHALHNPAAALPLSRIRDKLRAIRQRATEAGILTRAVDVPAKVNVMTETEMCLDSMEKAEIAETGSRGVAGPVVPSFEIPSGSREERLAAFAAWARQVLREDGGHVLVMSDDGEVLWGGEAKAGLVLSTMMAWGAAIRAGASAACTPPPVMRQPLASGHVLTVIPCETSSGVVHAAVAAPEGLSEEVAQILRGALCAAMAAT